MSITAFAPATVANINVGFDVLGMAISQPGDEVMACFNASRSVRIAHISGDGGKLPREDAALNTAGAAVIALCQHLGETRGIDLHIHKKMPLGSGLGSSAASAVAAVVAANALLGSPLTKLELLPFVLAGEAVASGTAHGDNVFPSLLGGIVLIRSYQPLDVVQLPVPQGLCCAVLHPSVEILTKEARSILPTHVPMKDAVQQTGNMAGFIASLYTGDFALLSRSLVDVLVEPYRSALLPAFDSVKSQALDNGALAFGISGSGPSMFAFAPSLGVATQIGGAMQTVMASFDIASQLFVSYVNGKGAHVLE